jgi:hypothetical protein
MTGWSLGISAFLLCWFLSCSSDADITMSDVIVNTQALALYDWFVATGMEKTSFEWFSSASNLTEYDYCAFHGVTCDDQGYVTALDLNNSGLVGTIPDLRLLFRLARLQASGNFLHGPVPDSLHEMKSLQFLFLSENYLSGPLPAIPVSTKRFLIAKNALTGTIPESICDVEQLTTFDISRNTGLRGTIPDCMADLAWIERLRVDGTSLTGSIPSALCAVREMNGLTPNTYGCDGVACGAGYYGRVVGRQVDSEPCQKCEVPSNVIGSTRCRWFDYSEGNSSIAPSVSHPPSDFPSSSPSMLRSGSPVVSSYTLTPSPGLGAPTSSPESQDLQKSEAVPRHGKAVIIATVLVGLAFVGVLSSIIYRTVKRKRDSTEPRLPPATSTADVLTFQTPEGAEVLTKISSFDNGPTCTSSSPDDGSAIAHALDSGAVRIRNRATGIDKRSSILRPTSIGSTGHPGVYHDSSGQSPTSRKVRFDLPTSLSYSPDSLDFLSSDSSLIDEEREFSGQTSHIDPETWASWIMDGAFTDCSPIEQPPNIISNVSPTPQPSAPLLSPDPSPPKWERFDGLAPSRAFGACQMFPSCRPASIKSAASSPKRQGSSALTEAFRCGWSQEDDLSSVAAVPYGGTRNRRKSVGGSKDVDPVVEAGQAEI